MYMLILRWRGVCTAAPVIIEEKGELSWDHNFRDMVARINGNEKTRNGSLFV